MKNKPILIVMLTHNDLTVKNAREIFGQCADTKAEYFGIKEKPLPGREMQELFGLIKSSGKKAVLESVTYTEAEGLESARAAVRYGCHMLMGTVFSDAVCRLCNENGIKYLPFAGKVSGRPSVLEGDIPGIVSQSREYIRRGAFGIDLLAYRYTGDSAALISACLSQTQAPVCIAGSINSETRLGEIKKYSPWGFTVGSAFFENRFGESLAGQINKVCEVI